MNRNAILTLTGALTSFGFGRWVYQRNVQDTHTASTSTNVLHRIHQCAIGKDEQGHRVAYVRDNDVRLHPEHRYQLYATTPSNEREYVGEVIPSSCSDGVVGKEQASGEAEEKQTWYLHTDSTRSRNTSTAPVPVEGATAAYLLETSELPQVKTLATRSGPHKYVFIGDDVGTLRLFHYARHVIASNKAQIVLISSAPRVHDVLGLEGMLRYARHAPTLDLYCFVHEAAWRWPSGYGRLTTERIKPLLPMSENLSDVRFVVSGSAAFVAMVQENVLRNPGAQVVVDPANIYLL